MGGTDQHRVTKRQCRPYSDSGHLAGKFLVRGGKNRTNDGINSPRTVVVEFPNYDTAIACYDSPEYQEAHDILEGHVLRHHQIVESS